MAIGDTVIVGTINALNGYGKSPLVGTVVDEELPQVSVAWESGLDDTPPVLDENLMKVLPPTEIEHIALIGRWVQVLGYANPADGTPKSPAASGLVMRVLSVVPYDGEGPPENVFLVVATQNGRSTLVVPVECVRQEPGRRAV